MKRLDWQNNYQNIRDRGQYLLDTKKWTDCSFLVGNSSSNQKVLAGHKLILAMASPVFERMFYGNFPDKTDPIVIPDVQPDAFRAMLEYIYSDKINISSFEEACELCYLAKKYLLPHVVAQCTHFLSADLSPKNAWRTYEFAKFFDEPSLMQSRMAIIAEKTKEVLADPNFCDIELTTLLTILDCDKLNIDTELDLFNAVLRYAMERGLMPDDKGHVPSTSAKSQAIDEENNEKDIDYSLLKEAVKKIRFLTLSPQQFAEGPARSKLLQQHEALSIIMNISSPDINNCPMPEGFCTSRVARKIEVPHRTRYEPLF